MSAEIELVERPGGQAVAAPIELKHVDKVYRGGVHALRDVTLRIDAGERVCLLGPNGAGKTTIIRLLNGALRPTQGEVRLFGVRTEGADFLAAKRRTGVVPQAAGMYDDFTLGEYLALVQRLYQRDDGGVTAERLGLVPYLGRRMAQLSGGFQRRATLAAAIIGEPELLLLDEPTVGLDPIASRETHALLQEAMRGRTVLLCTHNLTEAEALCESVIIINSGRVLLHEQIAALRQRFLARVYLEAANGSDRLVAELGSLGYDPRAAGDGVHIQCGKPKEQVPEILRRLMQAGVEVYQCRIDEASLEDMFVDLLTEDGRGS